ncbi:MAG: NAD regulator [Pseudomonadota bacterium]
MASGSNQTIGIDLTAAVTALVGGSPAILTVGQRAKPNKSTDKNNAPALPSGPFTPLKHRTIELGLRGFVEEQTGFTLGYIEQLYTFGDRGRHATVPSSAPHMMSVGYLALTRDEGGRQASDKNGAGSWAWQSWYSFFPWEDWRAGRPAILDRAVLPALQDWLARDRDVEPPGRSLTRDQRVAFAFGDPGSQTWDEERVLERYELLYEAGLTDEAVRDGRAAPPPSAATMLGQSMALDHRRILATAIARLRGKLKYRPVVFELMPNSFTLTGLQTAVEAVAGRRLHKQNFRRLVDNAGLVEPTGSATQATGGRPAALYRFRRNIIAERPAAGLRLGQPVVR